MFVFVGIEKMTGKESAHMTSSSTSEDLADLAGAVSLNGTDTKPPSPQQQQPQLQQPKTPTQVDSVYTPIFHKFLKFSTIDCFKF